MHRNRIRLFLWSLAVVVVVGLGAGLVADASTAGKKMGLCLVCQVSHGEAEEEEIKAVRTYEGREYGFCSEKCAKAFEADPIAYLPPVFPRPAPAFALTDLSGKPISNESLKGQVVLLDFWATWCKPCKKAMPEFEALQKKHAEKGFVVVGISIDEGGPGKVQKYLRSNKITYRNAVDSERDPAWEAFRVKAIPAAYLLDREGRIVAQWTGSAVGTKELESQLATLLAAD